MTAVAQPGEGDWMRDGAQSIRRALAILRTLAVSRETGLGLVEIADLTGLRQPTAHRILKALVVEGIVERKQRTRRYALGSEIHHLALARPARSRVLQAAEPHLRQLGAEIGDTVFLTLRTGLDTICIARQLGSHPIQVLALDVGDRRPLGVSSAGFAIMAAMSSATCRRILTENRSRIGALGLSPGVVAASITQARSLGYSVRERGIVPGTRAVSIAFRDEAGGRNAAITVAAIARRLQSSRAAEVAQILKRSAGEIESAIGPLPRSEAQ